MQSSRLILTWRLIAIVVAMFAFSFFMIPMFHWICHATGMHAKPSMMITEKGASEQPFRLDIIANHHAWLPVSMKLDQPIVKLVPGHKQDIHLVVTNNSKQTLSINALVSTGPEIMARKIMADFPTGHLDFQPNESKEFDFHVGVGGHIPEHIKMGNITLFFADENEMKRLH